MQTFANVSFDEFSTTLRFFTCPLRSTTKTTRAVPMVFKSICRSTNAYQRDPIASRRNFMYRPSGVPKAFTEATPRFVIRPEIRVRSFMDLYADRACADATDFSTRGVGC